MIPEQNSGTGITVVVVLYNGSVANIRCLDCAMRSPYVKDVVVCDNSTRVNDNAAEAVSLGVSYVPMGGNKGLPAAYRRGVAESRGDVVCIFDDDTSVDLSYFEAVSDAFEKSGDLDIALPLVMADDFVLSPCRFNGIWAKAFSSVRDIHDSDVLSGINSGMAVRRAVFARVRHDERLFLDFVDHRFVGDARKAGMKISYLDGPVLHQDFSLGSDTQGQAAARYRIYKADSKVFFSDSLPKRICGFLLRVYRGAKLSLRYGTIFFGKDKK